MFPWIGSLISGGASLLGGIFSSDTSAKNTAANIAAQQQMQQQTQDFNAGQADLNRQFQSSEAETAREYSTSMSNSAYQRASADMTKAGLNPMMMFGSGSAASTPASPSPSGSTASVGTPNMALHNNTSPMQGLAKAAETAVSSAVSLKTYEKMTQEIANLQTQQAKTAAETATEAERPAQVRATTATERERAKEVHEQIMSTANTAQLKSLAMPHARFSAKSAEDLLTMPEWVRAAANIGAFSGKKIDDALSPVLNSARTFKSRWPY